MGVTILVPLLSKVTGHIAIDNGLGNCHSLQREGKGKSGGGGGGGVRWREGGTAGKRGRVVQTDERNQLPT